MAVGTQALERSLILIGTQFTGVSPALPRHLATAALGLGGVEGFGNRTFPRLKAREAEALSGVKAAPSVVREYEARRAFTLETTLGVETGP